MAMRLGRGFVLLLAFASAAGAMILVRNTSVRPVPPAARSEPAMAEVLVAAQPIAAGEAVEMAKMRWQPWPAAALPANATHRATGSPPTAFAPALARHPLAPGEPVTEGKLARPGDGGVMAGLIAPGMRAVAVPLREDSAAGGFIQPHDRVDVIWTPRTADSGKTGGSTKTLLYGAKVLAIGKTLQPRAASSGDGRNATLELTPAQARIVADARAGGEISLALIAAGDTDVTSAPSAEEAEDGAAIRILRFGRQSLAGTRN